MKKLAFLLIPLSLAACAPAQMGVQSTSPRVMSTTLSPINLKPGQTVYVQYNYSRAQVKVNDRYFDELKIDFDNVNGQSVNSVQNYAGWLKMTPSELPEGVTASLVSAFVGKYIQDTANTSQYTEVRYFNQVRVVVKVTAESDAKVPVFKMAKLTYTDGVQTSEVPLVLGSD